MKKFTILILFLIISSSLFSEESLLRKTPQIEAKTIKPLKTVNDTSILLNYFFRNMISEKFSRAFSLIEPYFPIPKDEFNGLKEKTASQLSRVKPRFGDVISFELIDEKLVKDTFLKYVYVVKYEKHIVRWIFIFYKPKDKWQINSFVWDDKINDLF